MALVTQQSRAGTAEQNRTEQNRAEQSQAAAVGVHSMHMRLIRVVTGSQPRNSPLTGAHLRLHDLPLQPPPAAAPAFVSLLPFVA